MDLTAVTSAMICAGFMWFCQTRLAGIDLTVVVGDQTQEVGLAAVLITTAVASLLGITALRLLETRSSQGLKIWTILAAGVALVSALGPLSSATTAAAAGTLIGMHAVVAVVLIAATHSSRRWSRR